MNEGWDMRQGNRTGACLLQDILLQKLVEIREFSKTFPSIFQVFIFQNSHSVSTNHWAPGKIQRFRFQFSPMQNKRRNS